MRLLTNISSQLSSTGSVGKVLSEILDAVKALKPNDYTSSLADILDAVKALKPNDYTSSLADILDAIKNITVKVDIDKQSQADSSVNLWDAIVGALDIATLSAKLATLGDSLKSCFPFCLVFFVVSLLGVFAASPVTPDFSTDLLGQRLVLNLSMFDGLAAVCRALIVAVYVVGLYRATRDWLYGDDSA